MNKLISEVLLEASIDERIQDGIVDLSNHEHAQVLAERLLDRGVELSVVVEVMSRAIETEGKFPERQAYNKEGWLVTFPSTEYKNAAIKRGSHFSSDPTHGKGGMNTYYKKKGKQKRIGQQDPSRNDPTQQTQPTNPQAPQQPTGASPQGQSTDPKDTTIPPTDSDAANKNAPTVAMAPTGTDATDKKNSDGGEDSEKTGSSLPSSDTDSTGTPPKPSENPSTTPTPAAPPVPEAPSFVNVSIEFAKKKMWNPTPFGEWRNSIGDTVAIVALSGEVVPIKSTDREELKLLAAKKQL